MAFGLETGPETVVNIKVIGVGGGGNNVVNRMVKLRHQGRGVRGGEHRQAGPERLQRHL